MDYKEELQNIEKKVEANKIEKAKVEERLAQFDKEEQEQLIILDGVDVKLEDLENTLNQLDFELEEELKECKKILELT